MSECMTWFSMLFRLGAYKKEGDVGSEQDFAVTKIVMHPDFHYPKRYSNDIALLKLNRPAIFNRCVLPLNQSTDQNHSTDS